MASENTKISQFIKPENAIWVVGVAGLISVLMHLRIFSLDLMGVHVWRQTETQTVIQNFYEESLNIFNPRINNRGDGTGIFRMEFPLMQWVFALFYKVFGNYLIITRILSFIIGLFTLTGFYKLSNAIFNNKWIAAFGTWAFNFSPVFYYYTLNPLPDNAALCMAVWALFYFFKWKNSSKNANFVWFGFFLCIASLIKLPFILYGSIFVGYAIHEIFISKKSVKAILQQAVLLILLILPAIIWYASVIKGWNGNGIVDGMLGNKSSFAVLLNILRHNVVSTLPESLVNYAACLFFILGVVYFFKNIKYKSNNQLPLTILLIILTAYFIFELNMIDLVHDYYLMPFLPLIFLIVGYGAYQMFSSDKKNMRIATIIILLILPITAFLRINTRWKPASPGFNVDLLNYKSQLRNAVPDNALCVVGHDQSGFIFLYYVHKKGWTYNEDWFNNKQMEEWVNKGAKYFYSDSRKIDENEGIKIFLGKKVAEQGSVIVYELHRR
jgi:4-amino-4-deoxy-L-arabinose transferase-like glycosyltransferase